MKKFLIALGIAIFSIAQPANAGSVTFGVQIGNGYERYHQGYNRQQYDRYSQRNYGRSYGRNNYLYRRYFASLPSYYEGRCYEEDLIVRDPFTGRIVCMDRDDYRNFIYEYRGY